MPGSTTLGHVQLNRDRILTAAVDILTEYGLGDLTMRRLARTLDVAPGALYWHFPSKQDLLGGIAGRILATEVPSDAAGEGTSPGSWRERTYSTASRLLGQLLGIRDGAEVVAAALAAGTATRDPAETLAEALEGSPSPDRGLTGWVLSRYLLGAATDVQTAQAAGVEPRTVPQVLSGVDLVLDGLGN